MTLADGPRPAFIDLVKGNDMTDNSANTLFGKMPQWYGVISLAAACLAWMSWPLMVVVGFLMVYIAALSAGVAVVAGLIGVGAGLYYKEYVGVVTGAIGLAAAGSGVCLIVYALMHF